jgi:hypothetical protein
MTERPESKHFYSPEQIEAIIAACPEGLPEGPTDRKQADPLAKGAIPSELVPYITDRRTALVEGLEVAAAWYTHSQAWADKPSPSHLRDQFQSIETAAEKLLKAVQLPNSGNPDDIPPPIRSLLRRRAEITGRHLGGFANHPATDWEIEGEAYRDYHGIEQLRDVIEGVKLLRIWAAQGRILKERKVSQGRDRNKGDQALRDLIGNLAGIWVEVFEKRIATSVEGPGRPHAGEASGPFIRFLCACVKPLGVDKSTDALRALVRRDFGYLIKLDSKKC